MTFKFKLASLALPALLFVGAATAQTPASGLMSKIQVSGLVDGYASLNFNNPPQSEAGGQNQLYTFDTTGNAFGFNLAELDISVPVGKPGSWGFTSALIAGPSVGVIEGTNNTSMSHVLQAYGSYQATSGLKLDFGRFVTPLGAEVIESPANWNYSRSILFGYAIPFDHFGFRATETISPKLSVYGMIVNGWNNVAAVNSSKTYGAGFSYTPSSPFSLVENVISGPETPNDNHDLRTVTDTTMTVTASPAAAFMVNYDFGEDKTGGTNRWQGVAGYLHFTLAKDFSITPRLEWYWDPQGFTTGTAQTLNEQTLTFEYKSSDHVITRAEFRHDHSDVPFFEKSASVLSKDQSTATLGLMFVF